MSRQLGRSPRDRSCIFRRSQVNGPVALLEVFIVAMISLLLASAIGLMVPILLIGRA